ncbi:hypothetical protein E2562_031694 [Oryza meyeriana var. granulata]|uniref:Reverse transcriptase Ty1/copia-type domain-containing protein n=1 Tax=Oryza meyeriana var. granulata TaxID=110450 RepID=A0A6G1E4X7_9ORYZ|nr:hypothetical protein E2562_031694 [Oryza meyeriana var. granulata]
MVVAWGLGWQGGYAGRGHKPIGLKWVFKLKKNIAGEVIKHKARLVAKGYVQRQGRLAEPPPVSSWHVAAGDVLHRPIATQAKLLTSTRPDTVTRGAAGVLLVHEERWRWVIKMTLSIWCHHDTKMLDVLTTSVMVSSPQCRRHTLAFSGAALFLTLVVMPSRDRWSCCEHRQAVPDATSPEPLAPVIAT